MSITLTRQELYNGVWAEPVDTLAKQFGPRSMRNEGHLVGYGMARGALGATTA
jgi:hypothetical protein